MPHATPTARAARIQSLPHPTRAPRRTSITLALLTAFGGTVPALAANVIVPTGKTGTELKTVGTTTDITTTTVKGGVGLNAFSRFEVDRGNLVNLQVPSGAATLLNVVYDSPILINGIVNGVKDGTLGGRIVFADPHGMVVGASGVLNVGSLTVVTPTRQFADGLFDGQGGVDLPNVNRLVAGGAPGSSTGLIRIDGQVNALDTIRLLGAQVEVHGRLHAGADAAHEAAFASAVNTSGLVQGQGLAIHDGAIEIVATDTASVAGTLDVAGHTAGDHGGQVSVTAATVDVAAGAVVDASGDAGGGRIDLGRGTAATGMPLHAGHIGVAAGAALHADAAASGDGGTITVWGDDGNHFAGTASARGGARAGAGGLVEVSGHRGIRYDGRVDTTAAHGALGSLLIDPDDIRLVATDAGTDPDTWTVARLNAIAGTNVTLEATNTLTVGADTPSTLALDGSWANTSRTLTLKGNTVTFKKDTALRTGGANVTVNAATIAVNQGARVDATGGDVVLAAYSGDTRGGMGDRSANASVQVDGALAGRTITVTATAEAKNDNTALPDAIVRDAPSAVTGLVGFRWADATAHADASVHVGATADIHAASDLTLAASGAQRNQLHIALGDTLNPGFNSVAVHGAIAGTVEAKVDAGAKLSAGKQVAVTATNNGDLDLKASVLSYAATLGVTLAYGESDVHTTASIASGATVNATTGVNVVAHNNSTYTVQASSSPADKGKAGIAVALSELTDVSNATLGANLDHAGNVLVRADTDIAKNFTKAAAETGSGIVGKYLNPALLISANGMTDLVSTGTSLVMNRLVGALKKADTAAGGSGGDATTTLKVGAAVALVKDDFGAHANVAPSTHIAAGGADVVVLAQVADHDLHNIAQSSVNSATEPAAGSTVDPAAKFSGSAGVALAFLNHDASATVGDRTDIGAGHIGVNSDVLVPLDITWGTTSNGIGTYLSTKLGVPENILSSYANANGEATGVGLAGAVSWFDVSNTSRAWIGRNAKLTATAAPDASYKAALDGGSGTLALPAGVNVQATTRVDSIDVAGNISALLYSGTGGGANTTAVGGAFTGMRYHNDTVAAIDDDTTVTTGAGDVRVQATSTDNAYVLAPSTGDGASIGINGAAAYAAIDNHTTAAISNRARVTAADVDIGAHESLTLWTVAGGFNRTGSGSVGASFAYNDLAATTSARIGDVADLRSGADDSHAGNEGNVTASGSVHVGAVTDGWASALAVAGTSASSNAPEKGKDDAAATAQSKAQAGSDGLMAKLKGGAQKARTLLTGTLLRARQEQGGGDAGAGDAPAEPTTMFSAAGSVSLNRAALATSATIDHVTVNTASLAVGAVGSNGLAAASGSAAFLSAGAPSVNTSAAVAAAVAVNDEANTTRATITDSTVTTSDGVAIDAYAAGQHEAVAIGVASNSQSDKSSGSGTGSASVSSSHNTTDAGAGNTTFTGNGTTNDVQIVARDAVEIGAGGGAAVNGGNTGIGAAVTYIDAANTVNAHLDGATVTGARDVTVAAVQPTRIVGGALQAGYTAGDTSAGGSFVVTTVANTTTATVDAQRGAGGVGRASSVAGGDVIVVATDDRQDGAAVAAVAASDARLRVPSAAGAGLIDFDRDVLSGAPAPTGSLIVGAAGSFDAGKSAYGAAFVYNQVANKTRALVTGDVTATSLTVHAADAARIVGVAAGVAVGSSGAATGVGSSTVNTIGNDTAATVGAADTATHITLSAGVDTLAVTADSRGEIDSGAGSLAYSKSGTSVGAAIAYNRDDTSTHARVTHARLDGGLSAANVEATQTTHLYTYAAAVGVASEKSALSGSYAQTETHNDTGAGVDASKVEGGALAIDARDAATVKTLAGGAAATVDGGATIGFAIAVNRIDNDIAATLLGGDVASGSAGSVRAKSVSVSAASAEDTTGTAIGLAGAKDGVVLAGSSAVGVSASTTTARIGDGADVVADGNVAVLASDDNGMATFAGAGGLSLGKVGVGAATAVNLLSDATTATIDGTDAGGKRTAVTAHARGGSTLSVDDGRLQHDGSLLSALTDAATLHPANLDTGTRDVAGLAVNASSHAAVSSVAVSAGIGKEGAAAVTVTTNKIGGSASARIDGAVIGGDAARQGDPASAVDVQASMHAASASLTGSIALSGKIAGDAAVDAEVLSGDASAGVRDTTLTATGALSIDAQNTARVGVLGAGVAAGKGAVGGTGIGVDVGGTTHAELAGGSAKAAGVTVQANSGQAVDLIGGSLGAGASAGIGAVFAVIHAHQDTDAHIGDTDAQGVPLATHVDSAGGVTVDATTHVADNLYAAAAGVAGNFGAAATVGVLLDENTTRARIAHVRANGGLTAGGALTVTATENDDSTQGIGALGFGAAAGGIGASIAVTEQRAQVGAQILDSATQSGSLRLQATNDQNLASFAVSAGAGQYFGGAATVSVVQLGSGDAGGIGGLTGGSGALGAANTFLAADHGSDKIVLTDAERQALPSLGLDAGGLLNTGSRNAAHATIDASQVTTQGGDAAVGATVTASIANTAGGVGLSIGAGVGGAAAASSISNSVEAGVDGGATLTSAGDIRITAGSANHGADGIKSTAFAGAAGFVGMGAAIGVATLDNAVLADAGGTIRATGTGKTVEVAASDTTTIDLQSTVAAAGFVGAAGVTVAEAYKRGNVTAVVDPAAPGSAAQSGRVGARNLKVSATSSGKVEAQAESGAAGIGATAGVNHALARDSVDVAAGIGALARIDAFDTQVSATRTPQTRAQTFGVGVAGHFQTGASVSDAQVGGSTAATVGDGAVFGGVFGTSAAPQFGKLTVTATQAVDASGASADAYAQASGGGILAGLNGAVALADDTASVRAAVGDSVVLPLNDVAITALGNSSQRANATGVSVSLGAGLGADVATASSSVDTSATLGRAAISTQYTPLGAVRGGDLTITAHGADDNRADATSGAGGMVAGAAAVAQTTTHGSTTAEILDGAATLVAQLDGAGNIVSALPVDVPMPAFHAGRLTLDSRHDTTFASHSNAELGAVAGGSGADARGNVDVVVAARVGDRARFTAGDIAIDALNKVVEAADGNNATGASGALVAGAGMSSDNHIDPVAQVVIGNGTRLAVTGSPLDQPGSLRIGAGAIVAATDSVKVDTGGAFAGLTARSDTRVTASNAITVGSNAVLTSVGDLELGTYSQANVTNTSYAHGYGLAGGASSESHTDITASQTIDVGSGALLDSWGNLHIATGRAPAAAGQNSLFARADSQVYFDGALDGVHPDARATVADNGTVTIADGVALTSVRDIGLGALAGVTGADASGTGHYRILGVPVTNSNASHDTSGAQTVEMNGSAVAGTRHAVSLNVNADDSVTADQVDWRKLDQYDPVGQLTAQVAALTALKAGKDAATAADIDSQISTVRGLIATLNGRGLHAGSPVRAVEVADTLAAGGNITIDSGVLKGHGTLDAWGGPTIDIVNDGSRFLVVDKLVIPNELGGNIHFNGAGQPGTAFTGKAEQHAPNGAASIAIANTYDTSAPGQTSIAPAIFLTDTIDNLGGALAITNKSGDLGQFGAVSVNSESILVPNGAFIVNTPQDGYALNGSAQAQYIAPNGEVYDLSAGSLLFGTILFGTTTMGANTPGAALPGGAHPLDNEGSLFSDASGGHGTPGSADEAVTYVANYIAAQRGYSSTSGLTLGAFLSGNPPQFADQRTGGTGTMFFYPSSAYSGHSSDAYQHTYGGDSGFYDTRHEGTFRYFYPAIGARSLTNDIAVLQPGRPADATKITRVGTTAIINAKYIDVNGTIKAGLASDFSVRIKPQTVATGIDGAGRPTTRDLFACLDDPACRPYANTQATLQPNGMFLIRDAATISAGDAAIDVYYDPSARQLVLQNISGGGGGSISLHGAIINTNATSAGNLVVGNGYAQVTVDNQTGMSLQTRDINTGNGNVGVVKITDTLQVGNGDQPPLTTWYVNRLGLGTSTYTSRTATDYADLAPATTSTAVNAQYNPLGGERYWWQYDADLTRAFTYDNAHYAETAATSPWRWTQIGTSAANSLGGVWRVSAGIENDAALAATQFHEAISGSIGTTDTTRNYTYHGDWTWTWDVVTSAHITAHNSVKADNPINISFVGGHAAGLVDVGSAGSIIVGGNIQNIAGATSLHATGSGATVTANAAGAINTQSLDVRAGAGIGSLTDPLAVTLTRPADGSPDANLVSAVASGGDVALALAGEKALIRTVATGASGDVLLHAAGDIANAPGNTGAVVSGRNLNIVSDHGAIGSAANPLAIHATSTVNAAGATVGGIVDASGRNGVALHQVGGDLYIGHISSPGDVTLVADGTLRDGRNIADTDRSTQLAAAWDALHLKDNAAGTAAATAMVDAYRNASAAQQRDYDALLTLGSVVDGGNFVLSGSGLDALRQQAAAAAGVAQPTDDQIQAYAQRRYQDLRAALAAPSDAAALTRGRNWSADELLYQINDAALAPASAAVVDVPDAGVKGAHVNLVSRGGDVGSLADAVAFDLHAGLPTQLSNAQKAALGAATSAGDLINQTYERNGVPDAACTYSTPGCRLVSFDIRQTRPIQLNAGQGLRASAAAGSVYVAGQDSLAVAGIVARDDARVTSEHGMTNAAGAGASAIRAGRDIVLQNGAGSIGSATAYLTVDAGHAVQSARSGDAAGGDLYLQALTGDLRFADLYAGGTAALRTGDSGAGNLVSINAIGGEAVPSIAARRLLLDINGDVYQSVGGQRQALRTRLNEDAGAGTVAGRVQGTLALANGTALRLNGLDVHGRALIGTDTGDLEVTQLTGTDVTLGTPAGRIVGTAGGTNLTATGTVSLDAHGGIGTDPAHRLAVAARDVDAASGAGDVFLQLDAGAGADPQVRAHAHTIDIAAATDFTASGLVSARNTDGTPDGGGDILITTTGSAAATLAHIEAGRDLKLDTVDGRFVLNAGATVAIARDLLVTMTGNGTMTDDAVGGANGSALEAGRDVVMRASALSLMDVVAHRNLDLAARTGDIVYGNLTALGGDINAAAAGNLYGLAGGTLRAGNDVHLQATTLRLNGTRTGNDAWLNVAGGTVSIAPGSASAVGRDLHVLSAGGGTLVDPLAGGLTAARDIDIDAAALDAVRADAARNLTLTARSGDLRYTFLRTGSGSIAATAAGRIAAAPGAQLDAALDARLSASGIAIDGANAGRDLDAAAGTVDAANLNAGRGLNLNATAGHLYGSGLLRGADVTIAATGDVLLDQVQATGAAAIEAGNALAIDRLGSAGPATLHAGGDAHVGLAETGDAGHAADLAVTAQTVAIDRATVSGNLRADAATLALGTVAVHGNATLWASGDASATDLAAGGTLAFNAGGTLHAIHASAGADATLQAVRLQLDGLDAAGNLTASAASLAFGDLSAGNNASLAATAADITGSGTLRAATFALDAARDVTVHAVIGTGTAASRVHAARNGAIEALAGVGDTSVTTGADATLGTVRIGMPGHAASLSVASGAEMALADVITGADLAATGHTLSIGRVQAGRDAMLSAGADADVTDLAAGRNLQASAGGQLHMAHGAAGADAALHATGLTLDAVDAGDGLAADATATLAYTTLRAGRDMTLTAGALLDGAPGSRATSGGDIVGRAGNVIFDTITAGGNASLTSTAADITGTSLQATAFALDARRDALLGAVAATGTASSTLKAGHAGAVDALAALGDTAIATGANATLGSARTGAAGHAARLDITSGADLRLDDAATSGDLNLAASAGTIRLGAADVAGDLAAAGQRLSIGTVHAGRDAVLAAAGDADVADLAAGRLLRADAGSTMHLVHATAGGDAALQANTLALDSVEAGADLKATARAALGYTTLASGRDMTLAAGDLLQGAAGGRATAAGNLAASADSLAFGAITAGGNASLVAGAAGIAGRRLEADAFALDAVLDIALQSASASGVADSTVKAGRALAIDVLSTQGNATIAAGADAVLGRVRTGTDSGGGTFTAASGGTLSLADGAVAGDIALHATDMHLGTLVAGRDLDARAGNGLQSAHLRAGRDLAASGSTQAYGDIEAAGMATVTASAGALAGQGTLRAGQVTLAAACDATVNVVDSAGPATLHAAGRLAVDTLTSSGPAVLDAGIDATANHVAIGDATHVSSLDARAGSRFRALAGDVWGNLGAHADAVDLGAVRVHGDAVLAATGSLHGAALTVDGDIHAGAGGSLQLDEAHAGGGADLRARDLALGTVAAGSDLHLAADGAVRYGTLAAGRDVAIGAGGTLVAEADSRIDAGRDLTLAAGAVQAGAMQAGRDAVIRAAGALTAGALAAGRDMHLSAQGALAAASIRSGNVLALDAVGGTDVGAMWTADLAMTTPGVLRIRDLAVEHSATLNARTIEAGLRATGAQRLVLTVDGYGGATADKVDLRVDAPGGLALPTLRARAADITSTAHANRIDRGYVTGTLRFGSPDGLVVMDNQNPAVVAGAALQLYAPDFGFVLGQQAEQFYTDAYVLRYTGDARPTVPNYQAGHGGSDRLVAGASAERDAERTMQAFATPGRIDPLARRTAVVAAAAATPAGAVGRALQIVINLGPDGGSAREEDITIDTNMDQNQAHAN